MRDRDDLTHLCDESDENLGRVLEVKKYLNSSGFQLILTSKINGLDMHPSFVHARKNYDCFVTIPKVTELSPDHASHFKRKHVTGTLTSPDLIEVYGLPK